MRYDVDFDHKKHLVREVERGHTLIKSFIHGERARRLASEKSRNLEAAVEALVENGHPSSLEAPCRLGALCMKMPSVFCMD